MVAAGALTNPISVPADGGTLAPGQLADLRTDLRPLLEAEVGLIGRLMIDFACITSERWPGGAALLLATACVPLAPMLALLAPLLFFVLRAPALGFARQILAPQPAPMPEHLADARVALATALARIGSSTRRWP